MLAIGDMFYLDKYCNSPFAGRDSLHKGWYIVKGITLTHLGRIVDLIDMMDGRRCRTRLTNLCNVQLRYCYSRSEFDEIGLHFQESAYLVQRYFELMVVPERINWIVEGF